MEKTHLFLFDIDGTLIPSGGAGLLAMQQAVLDLFGVKNGLEGIDLAGRTDLNIAYNVFRKFGEEWMDACASVFYGTYMRHLAEELPRMQGCVLSGVLPLLNALNADPRVATGLLTGNSERVARFKLSYYGIWDYFKFGAFAEDDIDRNKLAPHAQARAKALHGVDFPPERTFVLGDTPHDINCGKAIGAKTVAVATGSTPRDVLAKYKPDFLFDNFGDVPKVLQALMG
ncbi:MAG: HAD family hydrolase [Alphaproteobacteria bacterium]|nr:HAD family hydrolase [Alphaproteobacteria bacterium]